MVIPFLSSISYKKLSHSNTICPFFFLWTLALTFPTLFELTILFNKVQQFFTVLKNHLLVKLQNQPGSNDLNGTYYQLINCFLFY